MMGHLHWVLFGVSFALGMALTFVLTIRSVKHHARVETSGEDPEPPTTQISPDMEPPTTMIPVETASPTTKMPVAKDAATTKIRVGKSAAEKEASGSKRVTDKEDPRGCVRAVRAWFCAGRRPRQRAVRLDGEGPIGYQVVLHARRRDIRPNRRPGVVQGRGIGGARLFHAVAQELEEVRAGC